MPPPRFISDAPEADGSIALTLQIPPDTLASLEAQARLHRMPINRVMVHAVLVYLADMDMPRLAKAERVGSHVYGQPSVG